MLAKNKKFEVRNTELNLGDKIRNTSETERRTAPTRRNEGWRECAKQETAVFWLQ